MAQKQLKDSTGTNFYPYTDLNSVVDGNNNTLNTILNGIKDGTQVKYTGTTGDVITNNTTLNVALKAIDDAIGDVETLLASI